MALTEAEVQNSENKLSVILKERRELKNKKTAAEYAAAELTLIEANIADNTAEMVEVLTALGLITE